MRERVPGDRRGGVRVSVRTRIRWSYVKAHYIAYKIGLLRQSLYISWNQPYQYGPLKQLLRIVYSPWRPRFMYRFHWAIFRPFYVVLTVCMYSRCYLSVGTVFDFFVRTCTGWYFLHFWNLTKNEVGRTPEERNIKNSRDPLKQLTLQRDVTYMFVRPLHLEIIIKDGNEEE